MTPRKNAKPRLVMKFGGTSVGGAEKIRDVSAIICEHAKRNDLVVVVSAMAGVTDMLIGAATAASHGDESEWKDAGRELSRRTQEAANQLVSDGERPRVSAQLANHLKVFDTICAGFGLVREVTPRSMDALSSLGEVLSATLLEATLQSRGLRAKAVDATELIITDDHFGCATPLFAETDLRISGRLGELLEQAVIPVVTGFRGATREGLCTTLGRGASDYTATIVGSALDADEIWIWTDVDGVMTADPRLVATAQIVPEISYGETIELSFFGAKVLHSKAVQPAMKKDIPVRIKNTFNPACPGTRICSSASGRPGVKALTSVGKACLVTVSGDGERGFAHLAAKIFSSLSIDDVPTLMVTQSSAENVICFAIHQADETRVRVRLESAFELEMRHDYMPGIEVMPDVGIVVAVGEKMKGIPGIAGRMFGALGRRGINIIAIAQGSSELSISLAVKSSDVPEAVRAIHEEFQL